jgi:hypothetical protein
MTVARAVAIASAVVTQINAANLGVTAERSYADWDLELQDETGPRCDVVTNSVEQKQELFTRGNAKLSIPIDIAIRQKFGAAVIDATTGRVQLAAVDDLIAITEAIAMMFTPKAFYEATGGNWAFEDITILANPIRQHLRQLHQFTSVIRITFRTGNP